MFYPQTTKQAIGQMNETKQGHTLFMTGNDTQTQTKKQNNKQKTNENYANTIKQYD